MTKNQINYLLVLATLLVLGFYVNFGVDIFMKVKFSSAMAAHAGAYAGGPRLAERQPRFSFPQGMQPSPGNAMPSQRAMAQKPPLPSEIQKFLEARKNASKMQVVPAKVSEQTKS